ncbi:hypothetical protein HYX12_03165 [Candidatus Woesearchaeota archaeon]|nr:hypothetical protein [Candidatus Woesearchaeota archaeon]
MAERIASSLERFGSARFKSIGHKVMENVINSGALGVELVFSGKLPSARAKSWRFYQGYLKKCGEISVEGVRKAQASALLKSGIIGVKVAIMPPDLELPDYIEILAEPQKSEDVSSEVKSSISDGTEKKSEEKKPAKKRAPRKKAAKKKEGIESSETVEEKPLGITGAEKPAASEKTSENPIQVKFP